MKEVYIHKDRYEFSRCPRCGSTMEREYQLFCDRCGQRLNWSRFNDAEVRYIEWDGPDEDSKEETDGGFEEDNSKID